MAVIQLRPQRLIRKKRVLSSAALRQRLLADLRRQSEAVVRTRCWHGCDDLAMLAYLARTAGYRARSVQYRGVCFPLLTGIITRQVRDPDTNGPLVGVVT
jgi:hypothetical protein